MQRIIILITVCAFSAFGCNADSDGKTSSTAEAPGAAQTAGKTSRGGTIKIGDDSWTLVPSTQCSIYPGNVVSIAGHAAEDPSIEIVIDYGGPTGITIGEYGTEPWWQNAPDSLEVEIEGRSKFRGSATFNVFKVGSQETAEGSFDITC